MRKLMWFTVGFAAAAVICAYILSGEWVLYFALLCGLAFVGILLLKNKLSPILTAVLLGLTFGMVYNWCYDSIVLSDAKRYDGKTLKIEIEAADYSFDTGYGDGVDGTVVLNGRSYKLRLFFQSDESVSPGDVLTGKVKLRYTPEGGLQVSTYHKGEGIFLLAYAEDTMELEKAAELPGKYFAAWLRKNIADRITQLFPEDASAFAKALLLGDDSAISFQDNTAFQQSGIRHVIAVSGLHVSILFSVIYFFTGRKRLLTLLAGLPVLFVFAAVAGFSPSVVRACIMQALVILALAADREYDPGTALSFAALVMLLGNPLTITSVSFQLSVGSMIGIFAFSQPIRRYFQDEKRMGAMQGNGWKARLGRWFVGSVSVTVSAMTVTLPLCAWYFGMVSVISILTNLLTLWVVSFIFCGIIAACLVSLLWLPAGTAVAYVVSWPVRYVLFMARTLAKIPYGSAYTDSPYTVLWIVLTILLVIVFLVSKKRSPMLLVAAVTVMYGLSAFATWAEPNLDNVRLTVLDVGQGQCVLLQSKNSAYLIDCGGEDPEQTATAAINALGAQGIYHLDGLILTHYDVDHANGASYLLETVDTDRLYLPDTEPNSQIRQQLEKQDVPISWITRNTSFDCGTGEITIYPAETGTEGNESSMCILFQGEKCDILITGDRDLSGEHQLMEQGNIPELEVLVVGHHGASTSTGLELLYDTTPAVAVISVGENNIHGHPAAYTLDRLKKAGCIVRRTDLEGTIIIRG